MNPRACNKACMERLFVICSCFPKQNLIKCDVDNIFKRLLRRSVSYLNYLSTGLNTAFKQSPLIEIVYN